jgi:hypothetical protein
MDIKKRKENIAFGFILSYVFWIVVVGMIAFHYFNQNLGKLLEPYSVMVFLLSIIVAIFVPAFALLIAYINISDKVKA